MPANIKTRTATPKDIPQLTTIQNHYILNTLTNLSTQKISESHFTSLLLRAETIHLPFLVAVPSSPAADINPESIPEPIYTDEVLGYACALPYNPNKQGYAHTLELSIYLSPSSPKSSGIGSLLLSSLISSLSSPDPPQNYPLIPHPNTTNPTKPYYISPAENLQTQILPSQLLAIMSIDPSPTIDAKLVSFYKRHGFEEVGYMKRIGWKFDRWVDVRILQRGV